MFYSSSKRIVDVYVDRCTVGEHCHVAVCTYLCAVRVVPGFTWRTACGYYVALMKTTCRASDCFDIWPCLNLHYKRSFRQIPSFFAVIVISQLLRRSVYQKTQRAIFCSSPVGIDDPVGNVIVASSCFNVAFVLVIFVVTVSVSVSGTTGISTADGCEFANIDIGVVNLVFNDPRHMSVLLFRRSVRH